MAPKVDFSNLKGPASDHIPSFAKAKRRAMAVEKIQQVYDFVEQRIIPLERVLSKTLEKTGTTPSESKLSLGVLTSLSSAGCS
ncbi:hypothetical protein QBC46DRAFT_338102 [Diplogelasinospora grovesii]|uniref:Uncharacterized protein n=1 Tax=Diplogelasinospora grovesii TaxID=303347 RepID=A0AAN6S7X0_9PEZI|nr:hypothetical protein QBC46DRAFT_338102 [Diplogelasinospora grovesii]